MEGSSSSSDEDYTPGPTYLSPEVPDIVSDEDESVIIPGRRQVRPLPPDDEDVDQESLPSVGGDRDQRENDEISEGESGDQGLPSIGGSDEHDDQRDEDLSDGIGDEELNGRDDWDIGSLPSVGNGDSRDDALEASSAPVGGFRVRVGPNGQEEIEFASESEDLSEEEGSDSEMDPPWNEMLGVEPAVEFALPLNIVASIADRVNIRRNYPQIELNRVERPEPRRRPPSASRNSERPTTARRRKGRKKSPQKKKKEKKPPAPPKPLGPLYINEDWDGNENFKEYSKLISKLKACRIYINWREKTEEPAAVSSTSEISHATATVKEEIPGPSSRLEPLRTEEESEKPELNFPPEGYKLGEFNFDRCGFQRWLWKNKSELLAAHEEIQDLILYVSEQPSGSILHLKIKRVVSGDDIEERKGPPPRLSKRDSQRELIFNVTQHYFYHVDPVGVPTDLFSLRGLGNRKTFMIDFNRFDMEHQRFIFDVVLLESAIVGEHDVHSIPFTRHTTMQDTFCNFLGITAPELPGEEETRQKEDIEWFYGQIRKYHKQEHLPPPNIEIQPTTLKPVLRNYQRDAVHWMLYREGCLDQCEDLSSASKEFRDLIELFLSKMYIPVHLKKHTGKCDSDSESVQAHFNPYTTYFCWSLPKIPPIPKGGILCDEMGLGKTVETLSLILLNEKPVPEELKEYFEGEPTRLDSLEGADQEEDLSSLEEVESDSEYKSSSSSEEMPSKRKRKKGRKGGAKKKKPRKTVNTKAVATSRIYRNKRARAASPCEFSTTLDTSSQTAADDTINEENNTEEGQTSKRPPRKSAQMARLTTKAALEAIEKNMKGGKRAKKGQTDKKARAVPGRTYKALKTLYDSALEEYRFADEARIRPKFHGRFYDTDIEMREVFECICGEVDGNHGGPVVKCSMCGSSQHAECVGFDYDLQKLFLKLGRAYLCPHCEALESPFETKSTLIITPPSISHQWIKEIQRHIQDQKLSILFYKGVSYHGYMPPAKLAKYDLVITTYNVLSAELDYVDLPHCNSADGRRFRNPKRFLSIPSPLPSVLWWRVCLDEAQMVEGIATKMSMMARRIQAVHRWCVTGTPVNKGLQDLFGLFVFLQVYPVSYDIWWNVLVRDAFFRKETDLLYELFGQLIWRNGKQDVLDQLGIPPQTEVIHWLNFSPVETHFYKQQFEICSNRILEKIQRLQRISSEINILTLRLSSLDRFILHGLLAPFLELRQACCHPQIVKGHLISLQKGTLTMEELLERLVKKTQLQCLDDNRQIIGALNGMAGLYIILNDWAEASEKYREVLQIAEKNKEHFQSDSLQLLHTMENLADVLDGNHANIAFTLRDTTLRSDAAELRKKYMKKYADAVRAAQEVVTHHSQAVDEAQSQFTMTNKESWWVAALKTAQKLQKIDGLILTLKQDLLDITKKNQKNTNTIANKFSDRWGLEQALVPAIMEMEQLRDSVLDGLEELQKNDPIQFVESAIRCHLRQNSSSYYNDSEFGETKCKLCQYHDNFLLYESVIFKQDMRNKISRTGRNWQQRKLLGDLADELTDKTKDELLQQEAEDLKATTEHVQLINEELRRGTWGDSETEILLKGILRFARVNRLSQDICDNGGTHMKVLEAVKKEFRFLRILWRQIFDQVSALDELSQATTRMIAVRGESGNQLEQPSTSNKVKQLSSGVKEKALKVQNLNVIGYHEIDHKMAQLQTEYATGQSGLALHMGQLLYLKTLKRNGYGKRGTINNEDCPICAVQLGKEWSVLRCGHSFCSECVKKMCPNALHSFQCPLCRHSMKFADVSFVDTTENEPEATAGTSTSSAQPVRKQVKGSHSTKVEAIIEKLLQLQDSHPGEKCIIFSTWTDVLDIIANALNQNDIKYCLVNQPGRPFHANLDRFKEREDLQVLLMPLTSGAKGLNIIEATHVILVEPILNLSSELQAIGRVHRIGQTKPTFVHRFYVRRTIEEKLFKILKAQDISSDEEGSLTVKDLQNLITTTSSTNSTITLE